MANESDGSGWGIEKAIEAIKSSAWPVTVVKNLILAFERIVTASTDVPVAWLQSKAQAIRDDSKARTYLVDQLAKLVGGQWASDNEFVTRAGQFWARRILKEQNNREAIFMGAVAQLQAEPPREDAPQQIDDDWLGMFSRVAEQRSNSDMQAYLALLLAGELRKPGTFSPITIQVLATITSQNAKLFQTLCNICMVLPNVWEEPFVLAQPFGSPRHNALEPVGFSFGTIMILQDAGLIVSELETTLNIPQQSYIGELEIGGAKFSIQPMDSPVAGRRRGLPPAIMALTTAGIELYGIVHKEPNAEYVARFSEWLANELSLELAANNDVPGERP